jgi:hypothetical protein
MKDIQPFEFFVLYWFICEGLKKRFFDCDSQTLINFSHFSQSKQVFSKKKVENEVATDNTF